jgi:hypothetical protein
VIIVRREPVGRLAIVMIALAACGCASGTAGTGSAALASAGPPASNTNDSEYKSMAVAAAATISDLLPGRTIAMYQTKSKDPSMRAMVSAVIAEYGYKEINAGEAKIICAPKAKNAPKAGAASHNEDCRYDIAEVLLQFNSLEITRDSGYVGGLMTTVPKGETKGRTEAYCLVASRQRTNWLPAQHSLVRTPSDCAAGKKH